MTSIRYLIFLVPVYALALAWTSEAAWRRSLWLRPVVVFGYLGVLWLGAEAVRRDLEQIPKHPFATIIEQMQSRGIKYGYADYWLAYATTFLADEAVVLEPIYSNYSPHYASLVHAETRIAYLDFDPPGIKPHGPDITIAQGDYTIVETTPIGGSIVLRVLESRPTGSPTTQ